MSKHASLAIIYFVIGDLLSCFQSVFRMVDNDGAGIFENHMSSVEVAGAAVLRMLHVYRVTASYTRKYDGRTGPDTVYNYDCYNWVYFFQI